MGFGKRYLGRVKVDKVDKQGNRISNLKKWLEDHPGDLYFDSKLEYITYTYLKIKQIKFKFHPDKVMYLSSYHSDTFFPSYISKKDIKTRKVKKGDKIPAEIKKIKIQEACYTPDFILYINKKEYFIETKGFADEAFKLRFKMFKNQLNKNQQAFVVKSLNEFKELLNLLI